MIALPDSTISGTRLGSRRKQKLKNYSDKGLY